MKRAPLIALGLGLFAGLVLAAPTAGSQVTGTSPQTLTLGEDAKVLLQCPGQIVEFRGMNPTDVHDGGIRDMSIDFLTNPDAVGITLTGIQTKLGLRNQDGGTVTCNHAPNR